MGNEAIARGLIEAGCTLASAYPGTPSTEIVQAVVNFRALARDPLHVEWSVNEKIAFEVALAHSYTGKRAAVAMKQVGLNVAADPFMRTAYLGVKGGLVLVVADDPGPHSSQNEQDSRQFAQFARVPVLDPASPAEARAMVVEAFELSEELELPVMLRPTTRICHARQNLPPRAVLALERKADFRKEPTRWAATPAFLPALHRSLNEKIARLSRDERYRPRWTPGDGSFPGVCVVASGICFATAADLLEAQGLLGRLDLCQVRMPYPLHAGFISQLRDGYSRVLVLEETYPVIEEQLGHPALAGRGDGTVPREGELTPDLIAAALAGFLGTPLPDDAVPAAGRGRRPSLCPGCPHRAAFHAIKTLFPQGIFPSDIGCYTLGLNLGAVDTVHCMGACISQGAGFYHAYAQDGGEVPPVVVTIGDFDLLPRRHPGTDQRRGAKGAHRRGDSRQRHHRHDRSPAGSAPGAGGRWFAGAGGADRAVGARLRRTLRGRGESLRPDRLRADAERGPCPRPGRGRRGGRGDLPPPLPDGPSRLSQPKALPDAGRVDLHRLPALPEAVRVRGHRLR